MLAYFSFDGNNKSCVTRTRFSPIRGESLAVAVDSLGYIRLMDMKAQKSSNYKYFENIFMENDINLPHLCDFTFSNCGKCVYVSSSDGFVSISSINMIGNHLNRDNHLITIHDTHIGGTFCVYPSPDYDFMIYTGGGDGFLRLWDLRLMSNRNINNTQENLNGIKSWSKPLMSLWAHIKPLSAMNFMENNRIVTVGFDENVRIWDGQTLVPIQTIDGGYGEMNVWDLIVDKKKSKFYTIGDSGSVEVFNYEGNNDNFICKNINKLNYELDENKKNVSYMDEEQLLFRNWRRICQYGDNLVIPTLDNQDSTKGYVINIETGELVCKLEYPENSDQKNYNISSVDAHPDPDVGLIISGGSVNNGRCTVWVDVNKDVK